MHQLMDKHLYLVDATYVPHAAVSRFIDCAKD
jgi:hypothetical protein